MEEEYPYEAEILPKKEEPEDFSGPNYLGEER